MDIGNPFSSKEIQLIKQFLRDIQLENGKRLSEGRLKKYVVCLRTIKRKFLSNLANPSLEDVKNAVFKLEKSEYKPKTIKDLKVILRRYLRWLNQVNGVNLDLSWFKIGEAKASLPEVLTEEEVKRLIEAQHEMHDEVPLSFHIHVSEERCMEAALFRGMGQELNKIMDKLSKIPGVHVVKAVKIG